ncbi:GNAT family N-acetyltransferase [Vibrio rhodolitus]|uniref:GNAT family N-acetyltransferase n=1 Tax=Vibrio rhodolitus TaxID=2231649 RepID=UPI000E0A2F88|nr:GNAT family N-acetyltransferase [Vibrio rhodolitus]
MHEVTFNQDANEFHVLLEGELSAVMKFERDGDVFIVTSTKVPESLQGKGYGKVMMESVLPVIESMGVKVLPKCSFVVSYLERNPQWQHLRVEN